MFQQDEKQDEKTDVVDTAFAAHQEINRLIQRQVGLALVEGPAKVIAVISGVFRALDVTITSMKSAVHDVVAEEGKLQAPAAAQAYLITGVFQDRTMMLLELVNTPDAQVDAKLAELTAQIAARMAPWVSESLDIAQGKGLPERVTH